MTTQHMRYTTALSYCQFPVNIRPKTGYPSIYQQCQDLGGEFIRINHGVPAGNVANFSPCILHKNGHRLISWRSQPEPFVFDPSMKYRYYNNTPTEVYVGELVAYDTIAGAHKIRNTPHKLSYEDPRLFTGPDENTYCQFVTSSYASCYDQSKHTMVNQPKICVAVLDEFGEGRDAMYPPIGNNLVPGKPEKNWCFYTNDDALELLYSTIPIVIKSPSGEDKVIDSSCLKAVVGEYPTYNSTAPIKVDDEWLVFYHWKYMAWDTSIGNSYLLYHTGAYTLDEKMTKVTRMSTKAIFSGSTRDQMIWWTDVLGTPVSKQPCCALPFGGAFDEDDRTLELAIGVNDSFMGIFVCPIDYVLGTLETIS